MATRNIIVIGASAGGLEALRKLVADLPPDLAASILIVWHMSPDIRGILPQILNRTESIYATTAVDYEPINPNRIYVAPPDHHLLVERGRLRVTRGPKENRFRPAVDPLFRSAAHTYGKQVIGVILSGALDDGTSGLWTIKNQGGIAVVQDPADAEVPSMPENALRGVEVDFSVPLAGMADLLVRLTSEEIPENGGSVMEEDEKTKVEIQIAAEANAFDLGIMRFGELTPYTCPECHGVLSKLRDGQHTRFRCHTGHAFSANSLLATLTEKIEDSLYNALRGIEESMLLLNHIGDHYAEANNPKLAASYFLKAKDIEARAQLIRRSIQVHEQLTEETLQQLSQET